MRPGRTLPFVTLIALVASILGGAPVSLAQGAVARATTGAVAGATAGTAVAATAAGSTAGPAGLVQSPAQPPSQAAPPAKPPDKAKDDQEPDPDAPKDQRAVGRVRIRMEGHEEPIAGSRAVASGDGFHPLVGYIVSGSGLSAGLNYQRLRLGRSPIGFDVGGEVSYSGFQLYRLQVGYLANRDTTETLQPVDADVSALFNDHSVKRRGLAAYADMRYIHYPADVFVGAGRDDPDASRLNLVWFGALFDGVVQYQFTPAFGVTGRVGLLAPGLWTEANEPPVAGVEPFVVPGLVGVPHFATAGGAAVIDVRDEPADPRRGAYFGAALWRFDGLGSDADDFIRATADGRWYRPLFSPRGVLALRVLGSVEVPDRGAVVPVYLQQTLGGNATLRGFAPYRFRGRALAAFSAEYRFVLNRYLDVGPFVDAGSVVRSFTRMEFGELEISGGIRAALRFKDSVLLNVGWGQSREGGRFFIGAGTLF